jgi:carbonic anhydrase
VSTYEKLFENNRRWVAELTANDPTYFEELAKGQQPRFLFIGCSDSRVPADRITGSEPGEMLVHRNVANVVVPTDLNLMSVLQLAVEVLEVEHVIVCGHYGCNGVASAVDGKAHGLIDKWLYAIKDVYRIHRHELDAISDPEERRRRLVELNVREAVYRVSSTSFVQRAWSTQRAVHVHGWVYDIHDGLLRDLEIDPDNDFDGGEIYQLTDIGPKP